MEFFQILGNGLSIGLEILGFILILFSTKTLVLKQGAFSADEYVDPDTGKPPETSVGPPNPKIYRTGIGFVIAGLIGQIIAMFL